MSDLISRKRVLKKLDLAIQNIGRRGKDSELMRHAALTIQCVKELLEKEPDAPSGTIVRCKECKYNFGLLSGDGWNSEDIVCTYHMSDGFTDDDYCSRGERMLDENGIQKDMYHT